MISEYTDKKECQRQRTMYEMKDKPVLMITERALVFQKIRVRFAKNVVLYAIPESPDTIEDLPEMLNAAYWETILKHRLNQVKQMAASKEDGLTSEQVSDKCKAILKEGRLSNSERSIVGLFSKYDALVLERMVGTVNYRSMLTNESKDAFHFG